MGNTALNDEVPDFYGVLIASKQLHPFEPAHIAAQILCRHSVKHTHPTLQFAMDGVDMLNMINPFLVLSTGNAFMVQRKVPGEFVVTFMAVRAEDGTFAYASIIELFQVIRSHSSFA